MKLFLSIPQETDDVTSDFDNIVENAKDCGILFILLLLVAISSQIFIDEAKGHAQGGKKGPSIMLRDQIYYHRSLPT